MQNLRYFPSYWRSIDFWAAPNLSPNKEVTSTSDLCPLIGRYEWVGLIAFQPMSASPLKLTIAFFLGREGCCHSLDVIPHTIKGNSHKAVISLAVIHQPAFPLAVNGLALSVSWLYNPVPAARGAVIHREPSYCMEFRGWGSGPRVSFRWLLLIL